MKKIILLILSISLLCSCEEKNQIDFIDQIDNHTSIRSRIERYLKDYEVADWEHYEFIDLCTDSVFSKPNFSEWEEATNEVYNILIRYKYNYIEIDSNLYSCLNKIENIKLRLDGFKSSHIGWKATIRYKAKNKYNALSFFKTSFYIDKNLSQVVKYDISNMVKYDISNIKQFDPIPKHGLTPNCDDIIIQYESGIRYILDSVWIDDTDPIIDILNKHLAKIK